MEQKKNLCAQIPLSLHEQVSEAREAAGQTTSEYVTNLLIEYFNLQKNGGNQIMANNSTRTMAFQIPETLFQRIKAHLERETQRTGKKYTQREFVLGLIEEALNEAERLASEESSQTTGEANDSPCEATTPEVEDLPPEKP
ncbi:translation initiation factor 2 [uncultured Oscillibacter sp.]|uniref:translation initiation factor 2 n=1 Tax=uncultured Oscillibacter sp. TaxID=876091 RepID=UPI002608F96E|nr:translation initiation factor 2 [uncultured Oscillibacter sp.]